MTAEEVRAWVASTRAAQGLPRHVEDLDVLAEVAADLRAPTTRPAAAERPREVVASSDRVLEPAGRRGR